MAIIWVTPKVMVGINNNANIKKIFSITPYLIVAFPLLGTISSQPEIFYFLIIALSDLQGKLVALISNRTSVLV